MASFKQTAGGGALKPLSHTLSCVFTMPLLSCHQSRQKHHQVRRKHSRTKSCGLDSYQQNVDMLIFRKIPATNVSGKHKNVRATGLSGNKRRCKVKSIHSPLQRGALIIDGAYDWNHRSQQALRV